MEIFVCFSSKREVKLRDLCISNAWAWFLWFQKLGDSKNILKDFPESLLQIADVKFLLWMCVWAWILCFGDWVEGKMVEDQFLPRYKPGGLLLQICKGPQRWSCKGQGHIIVYPQRNHQSLSVSLLFFSLWVLMWFLTFVRCFLPFL